MLSLQACLAGFRSACSLLTRFRVGIEGHSVREVPEGAVVRWLPVAGLFLGLVLWVLARLVRFIVSGRTVAGVLAAVVVLIFWWWSTHGRGLRGVMAVADGWELAEAEQARGMQSHFSLLATHAAVLIKGLGVVLLFTVGHGIFWLVLAPMLAATVYAQALTSGEHDQNHQQVHWYVAAAITVVVAGFMDMLIPGLLVLLLAWLAMPVVRRSIHRQAEAGLKEVLWTTMELTEILVVWIGLLAP